MINKPSQVAVGINSWVEHNNKSIFGEDADIFNPDRWLQDDKERLSTMMRHWMPVRLLSSLELTYPYGTQSNDA